MSNEKPSGFGSCFSQGETLREQVGEPAQRTTSPLCVYAIYHATLIGLSIDQALY
ncbi:hypothetical protein NIES37_17740 [Tolypothrix tenuis PCC 7101]|uniref:Uncharacterized protein n=1 Tax=Tolypothrix tenuis PCC 7101 TaxID=231146 RepID=A0A1Z4MWH7_9CYAN|nr:hypothetical protein [Aulosira sp. FACHB-113]BAY97829.1 hypothetical protein NIES37_17740 [Tolypothrix tenuis PCC 7101]BAZ71664.1 hypothetical protein NIES50_02100 [Aulosira laxa NIES-50]